MPRRGGRVVYCTCLENRSLERDREFESHPLRMETLTGVVQKGKRHGSELGYPTINIELADPTLSGVYAGRVILNDEAPYMAAIFADASRKILEAHILDFSDELYGLEVRVEVHDKLRESHTFETEAELKATIAEDVAKVREYFKN